jgi:6-phosphogluconolactonase
MKISLVTFVVAAVALILEGCGGGCDGCTGRDYKIGASIDGLVGSRLALSNNGVTVAIAPGATGRLDGVFSGLLNGTSYNITVATQPTSPSQTCVVTNGQGKIAGADVAITLSCTTTPARFLIAGSTTSHLSLTIATLDSESGALTAVAAPVPGDINFLPTTPVAVTPQGKFFYGVYGGGQIGFLLSFSLDPTSGAVNLIEEDEVGHPRNAVTDPSGKFLFLASTTGVSDIPIDPASGKLTSGGGANIGFDGGDVFSASVDPLDRFVYVSYFPAVGENVNSLIALKLDPASGALSRVAAPVAVTAGWVLPDPSGQFLYVGNLESDTSAFNTISAFKIDSATGTLTALAGSPYMTNGTGLVDEVDTQLAAIDPSGNYLYVASSGASNVTAYKIDRSSGQLTPISGSTVATGASPYSVAIEPLGRFIYVSDNSGVSAYHIDSTSGTLTAVSGSPFPFSFGGNITFSY